MSSWLDDPNFAKKFATQQPKAEVTASWSLDRFGRSLLTIVLAVVVVVLMFRRHGGDEADTSPVKVDSLHVLILEQNDERDQLDSDQLAVLNSVKVRKTVEDLGGQFRLIDADDDLRKYPKEWQALAESATLARPCVIVAAKGKKPKQFKVINVDTTVDQINSIGGK